jgi:O-antigen ligase
VTVVAPGEPTVAAVATQVAPGPAEPAGHRTREPSDWRGRSPLELFAAVIGLLLPIAFVTSLDGAAWSLRAAILLVVGGVGLPVLLSQTRGPRPLAARAAVAFLAVGAASAVLSQNHTTAIFGLYNQGTGLLFMASLAGAWAIGRSLRPEARPLLERALIVGILINVAVALLAAVVDLSSISGDLVDASGRSSGLSGNPVHLAALSVLALALIVARLAKSPATWAVPVVAVAAATQLSGTRVALVVMAAMAVWAVRRQGVRTAALLALLVVVGLAVGGAIAGSSNGSATTRSGSLGSWRNRPATWVTAGRAIVKHPLLGVGPGQFRTATSPEHPVSVALTEGSDVLFSDAHNIFVEYATTTGLLGLGAFVVWLVAAIRPARGWLLVGALGVLVIHLLEPQSVVATPLAFLALGASAPGGAVGGRRGIGYQLAAWSCLALAVGAGSVFLVGEFQARQAQLDLGVGPAGQAARLLPPWPRTASLLAESWLFHGITNQHKQADYQRSRAWRLVAVQRDSTDPLLWNELAQFDATVGQDPTAAEAEFTTALRLNPTSVLAMSGLAHLAGDRCDVAQQEYWQQRADQIAPPPPGRPRAVTSTCTRPASG